ncbi:MAG: amidohydrolase family protein [Breznakibacter sp.]
MDYLLIQNGLVVEGNKVFKADILIGNSKILEIGKSVRRPLPGTPVIDAGGRFVLPGGIDTTAHEILTTCAEADNLQKMLFAELTGGTTCIFETLTYPETESFDHALSALSINLKGSRFTDFAFHLSHMKLTKLNPKKSKLPFISGGISSLCVTTTQLQKLDDEEFVLLDDHLSQTGQTLIVELNIPEPLGSGYLIPHKKAGNEKDDHLDRLMTVLWRLKDANYPVLLSKLRYVDELEIVQKFIDENRKIFAELDCPCLLGGKNEFKESSLSEKGIGGTLDLKTISPAMFVELLGDENYVPARPSLGLMIGNAKDSPVFNRPDKFFGLKFHASMLYSLCVAYGNLAITDFVSCFSTRQAKLMGLYPRKGVLREGSDADIVIWNPDFDRNLYCNYPGDPQVNDQKLQGKADFVFVNGKMVFDGETFFRENLTGKYLYRTPCI